MEEYAQLNATAIVSMVQSPMRLPEWPSFVDKYRYKNITYIGTDSDDYQLEYLSRNYVHGLVGQVRFIYFYLLGPIIWVRTPRVH